MNRNIILGLMAVLAVVGVGCSQPQPTATATPAASPQTILEAAFAALQKQDSYHRELEMQMTLIADGTALEIPLKHILDFKAPDRFWMTMAIGFPESTIESELISIGDTIYGRNPETGEWEISRQSVTAFSPVDYIGMEPAAIRDLVLIGEEILDGTTVYHLKGNLRGTAYPQDLGMFFAGIDGELQAEYWIGLEDGRLKQSAYEGVLSLDSSYGPFFGRDEAGPVSTVGTATYSDYGKAVVIEAPFPPPLKSEPPDTALVRMLRFIPDTPNNREYLTFGDAEAWHRSWDIPRIDNSEELDALGWDSRAYWTTIMPNQTTIPSTLGSHHLLKEDQRGAFGFDLFNLDRFLYAGLPPGGTTVVEFSFDGTQIAEALTAFGYRAVPLATGDTLYSLGDDFENHFGRPTLTGILGELNRVALLDGQLVIAPATAIVTNALLAHSGVLRSLAENPDYIAAATALEDPALTKTGELVGAILMDETYLATPSKSYPDGPQLPAYTLVAFATRHSEGASYLILAVVFPEGVDADLAASILADRIQSYTSPVTQESLAEWWTFESATSVKGARLPVALVVMRAEDPPSTPEDADAVNTSVISWIQMIQRRDTPYLAVEPAQE